MSEIEKFEDFLTEKKNRAEKKADRKVKKAERKLDKAEAAFEKGKDDRGKRKLDKAEKQLKKAKELNADVESEQLEAELADIKETEWEDEFDIVSSKLGRKVKSRDFKYITKIKVKGDEISPEETVLFLKTVQSYINEFWEDVADDKGKEDYLSPHSEEMTIEVKNRAGKIVFVYSEGGVTDKAKLVIDKDIFDDEDNKEKLNAEIEKLIGTEHFVGADSALADNYRDEKDKAKVALALTPALIGAKLDSDIKDSVDPKLVQKIADTKTPNQSFINKGINILIEEKLNLGLTNTDEDRIYKFFAETHTINTINEKNIDAILLGYKRKKSQMRESFDSDSVGALDEGFWSDAWDGTKQLASDAWGGVKRGWQSVSGRDSGGTVKDLMWAFNTDAKTVSNDMNKIIAKLSDGYGKEVTKETINKIENIKKDVAETANESMTTHAGAAVAGGVIAKRGIGLGIGRGVVGVLGSIGPIGWITLGVLALGGLGYYLWGTFSAQQYQIAKIFVLMYASGSKQFSQEMKAAGIRINENKKLNIDYDKIKASIHSGELYDRPAEENEEGVMRFESFVGNKDSDKE